jgi:hypothetical protein
MPKRCLDDNGFVRFDLDLVEMKLKDLFYWFRRHVLLRALDATCLFIAHPVRIQITKGLWPDTASLEVNSVCA